MEEYKDYNKGSNFKTFAPREMHKAICNECQRECEVPFVPQEGRPIFCKECYRAKKPVQPRY